MRFTIFLALGILAHYLLARYVVSVTPWARARKRLVFGVALGIGAAVASLRVAAWVRETGALRSAVAVAMSVQRR